MVDLIGDLEIMFRMEIANEIKVDNDHIIIKLQDGSRAKITTRVVV